MTREPDSELLRPRMLYEVLAGALRQRIFTHELAPGDPIDEFWLASGYGVSRTPMREALKVLASEGLVELRARQGGFVARLAWPDIDQLFDVLDCLESFGVREATQARACLRSRDSFHRDLAEAAGNTYLPELVERIVAKLRLAFGPQFDSPEMQVPADFHAQLARSVAAGESDAALRLLAAYQDTRRRMAALLFARVGKVVVGKRREPDVFPAAGAA